MGQGNSCGIAVKLHHIAGAADAQTLGRNPQATQDQQITAQLMGSTIMRIAVENAAISGTLVLLPLLLDVDQRPLPGTIGKVLQAEKLQ